MFCWDKDCFIDIRGKQADFHEFFEDFEDMVDADEAIKIMSPLSQSEYKSLRKKYCERFPWFYAIAQKFISKHKKEMGLD